MEMAKLALIDNGITCGIDDVCEPQIYHYKIEKDKVVSDVIQEKADSLILTHGTVCYWLLQGRIKRSDYELYSIKIIENKTGKTTLDKLLIALQWCLEYEIDVICMSIGTDNYLDFDKIDGILRKLWERGSVIVAAGSNNGSITYPASSKYVVGVKTDLSGTISKGMYSYDSKSLDGIEIINSGDHTEIERLVGIPIHSSNSNASPGIAASVLKYRIENKYSTIEDVCKFLKENAITVNESGNQKYYQELFRRGMREFDDSPMVLIECDTIVKELCSKLRCKGYNAIIVGGSGDEIYTIPDEKIKQIIKLSGVNIARLIKRVYRADILLLSQDLPKASGFDLNTVNLVVSTSHAANIALHNKKYVLEYNTIEQVSEAIVHRLSKAD